MAESLAPSRSVDERERLAKNGPETDLRYHYRYVAADMAHRAALMFPKNHEEAALMLCVGGSWLRAKDPRAADKLYKALVRRNRNVPLGRKADAARWFPARCESTVREVAALPTVSSARALR